MLKTFECFNFCLKTSTNTSIIYKVRCEDLNGNGILDLGEDLDGDGRATSLRLGSEVDMGTPDV